MQLTPGEQFVLTHQLYDHTDSNTYYVQAVIRNGITDEIIETVNLTDRGDRRFSEPWQVPGDPSGQGFYISITTTVYSDSSYSTKSALYSEEQERLLVQVRPNPNFGYPGMGAAGGADIDYKKIKKLIKDEVSNIKFPKQKEVKLPKYPEVKLKPIESDIVALNSKIDDMYSYLKKMPLFESMKDEIQAVASKLEDLSSDIDSVTDSLEKDINILSEKENKMIGDMSGSLQDELKKATGEIDNKVKTLITEIKSMKRGVLSIDVSNFPAVEKKAEEMDEEEEKEYKPDLSRIFRRRKLRKSKS
jgi:predicted  nucleic acid-binding Zn-ribbon protein